MSKQTINIGTAPNAKNGDALRTAFEKVNANFTELYNIAAADATDRLVNGDSEVVLDEIGMLTVPGTIALPDGIITGNDNTDPGMVLGSSNKSVFVSTLSGIDQYKWKFGTDGNLTLPAGGTIKNSDDSIYGSNGGGISISDFGEGFSLTDADKVVTNKLYSTNETQSTQHYRMELDTNGVVILPDGSIINGSTIRGVAGTGELNYTGITIGPNSNDAEKTWIWVDHANAYITTNNAENTWTFDNNGGLTFPFGELTSDDFNTGFELTTDRDNAIISAANQVSLETIVGGGGGQVHLIQDTETDKGRFEIFFQNGAGALWIFEEADCSLTVPHLFPRTFTATVDDAHYDSEGSLTLDGAAWHFDVTFTANSNGTVTIEITNNTPWASNPGYTNGMEFTFTETDHGVPGYSFNLTLTDIQNPGPMMYTTNLAASEPPAYPATIKSGESIKLTADAASWTFGANGTLTLPDGANVVHGNVRLSLNVDEGTAAYLTTTTDDTTALYMTTSGAQLYTQETISINAGTGLAALQTAAEDSLEPLANAFAGANWTGAGYPASYTSPRALNLAKAMNPLIPDMWITLAGAIEDAYDAWQLALGNTTVSVSVADNDWTFGTTGNITFPDTSTYGNSTLTGAIGSDLALEVKHITTASAIAAAGSTTGTLIVDITENDDIIVVSPGWEINAGSEIAPQWMTVTGITFNPDNTAIEITVDGFVFEPGNEYTFRNPVPESKSWTIRSQTGAILGPGGVIITNETAPLGGGNTYRELAFELPAQGALSNEQRWVFANNGTLKLPQYNQIESVGSNARISLNGVATDESIIEIATVMTGEMLTSGIDITPAIGINLNSVRNVNITAGWDSATAKWDAWQGAEAVWVEVRNQDAQLIAPDTRPWDGMPSYEAYIVLANYNHEGPGLPPASNLAPAAGDAKAAYELWQAEQAAINVTVSAKDKTWTFGNDGQLTVPGAIRKDGSLYLNSGGSTTAASVFVNGNAGSIILRTANQETNHDFTFDANGNLTFPDNTVQTTAWTGGLDFSSVTTPTTYNKSTEFSPPNGDWNWADWNGYPQVNLGGFTPSSAFFAVLQTIQPGDNIIINGEAHVIDLVTTQQGGYFNIYITEFYSGSSVTTIVLETVTSSVTLTADTSVSGNLDIDGTLTLSSGAGFGLGTSGQLKVNDSTTSSLDLRDTGGRGFYTNGDGLTLRSSGDKSWVLGTDGKTTLPGAVVKSTVAKTGAASALVGKSQILTVTTTPADNPSEWTNAGSYSTPAIITIGTVDITCAIYITEGGFLELTVTTSTYGAVSVGSTGVLDGTFTNDFGSVTFNNVTVTAATVTTPVVATAIDLSKSINKLSEGIYTLADGVEGQIMYLVPTENAVEIGNAGGVVINIPGKSRVSGRYTGQQYMSIGGNFNTFYPFKTLATPDVTGAADVFIDTNLCTLIFTDDAWQAQSGSWAV